MELFRARAVLRPEPASDSAVHAAARLWRGSHRVGHLCNHRRHGRRDVREGVVGVDPGRVLGRQVLAGKT